ncbi:MAG: M23 family metallopeptidase [Clostridia bacterium]
MEQHRNQITFKQFLKQYAPLIIIITCVLAILTVVLITTLSAPKEPGTSVVVPNPDDDKPVVDPDDSDKPVVKPDPKPVVWGLPVKNYTIGMDYSATEFTESVTTKEWLIHKAIDFKVTDKIDVYAVQDGTVESIKTSKMDGTVIIIAHSDGIKSIYSSLSPETTVKVGASIKKGDKIGVASDSGYNEFLEGVHLHFEIMKNGVSINPRSIIANI